MSQQGSASGVGASGGGHGGRGGGTVVVQVSTCTASAGFVVHPMDSLQCLGGP